MQTIIREYFENLHSNKLENLEEMDKFIDAYKQPKMNQEDINHLNRPVTSNEIEEVIKSFPTKKSLGPEGFMADFFFLLTFLFFQSNRKYIQMTVDPCSWLNFTKHLRKN
jgi:hypothetical protein